MNLPAERGRLAVAPSSAAESQGRIRRDAARSTAKLTISREHLLRRLAQLNNAGTLRRPLGSEALGGRRRGTPSSVVPSAQHEHTGS